MFDLTRKIEKHIFPMLGRICYEKLTADMLNEGIADGTIIMDGGYKVLDCSEVLNILKAAM